MTEKEMEQLFKLLASHNSAVRDIAETLVGSPCVDPAISVAGGLRDIASAINELAEAVRETKR